MLHRHASSCSTLDLQEIQTTGYGYRGHTWAGKSKWQLGTFQGICGFSPPRANTHRQEDSALFYIYLLFCKQSIQKTLLTQRKKKQLGTTIWYINLVTVECVQLKQQELDTLSVKLPFEVVNSGGFVNFGILHFRICQQTSNFIVTFRESLLSGVSLEMACVQWNFN